MKVLNQEQMHWVDMETIKLQKIHSADLMDRAVHELYKHVKHLSWFDSLQPVYVFAGSGNNGGDGIGLARLLGEDGIEVTICYCDYHTPTPDNQRMRDHLPRRKYLTEQSIETEEDIPELDRSALIIDAMFGTGINRPVEGIWKQVIQRINDSGNKVISVDIPSGLHPDKIMKDAVSVHADLTLTIGSPKLTFFFPELNPVIGQWHIVDIQLSEHAIDQCVSVHYYIDRSFITSSIDMRRDKFSHKGTFGHALLVNGSYGKMGAAILAARSCIRSGVGLLTCHVPRTGYQIMQSTVPEAMVSVDQHDFYFHSRIDTTPYDAIGIGSGLNDRNGVCEALLHVIQDARVPLVLDADALNILAKHPDWLKSLPEESILTPHPGEFRRLFGSWDSDTKKLERQLSLSQEYKIFIVLKGANTSVSCPDGEMYFNSTGNPGMATAGSGDTLTGIITGLCAQGMGSKKSALLGVYIHGLAGDLAVNKRSQISMVSSDITEHLSEAFYQTFGI